MKFILEGRFPNETGWHTIDQIGDRMTLSEEEAKKWVDAVRTNEKEKAIEAGREPIHMWMRVVQTIIEQI